MLAWLPLSPITKAGQVKGRHEIDSWTLDSREAHKGLLRLGLPRMMG